MRALRRSFVGRWLSGLLLLVVVLVLGAGAAFAMRDGNVGATDTGMTVTTAPTQNAPSAPAAPTVSSSATLGGVIGEAQVGGTNLSSIDVPVAAAAPHGDASQANFLFVFCWQQGSNGAWDGVYRITDDAVVSPPYWQANMLRPPGLQNFAPDPYLILSSLAVGNTVHVGFPGATYTWIGCRLHFVSGLDSNNPVGPDPGGNYVGFGGGAFGTSPRSSNYPTVPAWIGFVSIWGQDTGTDANFQWDPGSVAEQYGWNPPGGGHMGYAFHDYGSTITSAQQTFYFGAGSRSVSFGAGFFRQGPGWPLPPVNEGFEPLPQTYGPCDGGLDALNQSGCWGNVNTLLGAYTAEVTDASMPAIGIPFSFTRSYTSANTSTGRLGAGWNDSYSAAISFQGNGDALVFDENGQQIYFIKQPDGTFLAPQGGLASLTAGGGGYQLLNNDQTRLGFDSNGRLLSIKDRNAKGVTLAYDGSGNLQTVTDSVGRAVAFTPNGDGTLQRLTLPDARHVDFGYTGGRLSSVTDLRGGVTTYGYDADGLLTTVSDQNQNTLVTNHYTSGRIDSQTDALGKQTLFGWDAGSQTATITDARSHVWTHNYQNNILVRTSDPLGDTTVYGYDANNNVTGVRDPRGNTTSMSYDERHNKLTQTAPAPLAYQETWTYNNLNDPLTSKDGRGQTTSYGYDAAGNLTSKTLPDPDGTGPLTAPVTQYGRDPAGTGLLVSETDPNNKTTLYGYDSQGNRTSVTSPLSEQTTMGYDAVGRMTSRVDARGNVTGCGCAAAHTTTFGYDNADHLNSQTDPGLPAKTWL
jgi:YD repeat-containing protein